MIRNNYSAKEEYEISLQLLGQRYNEALDRIDSLNAIVSDLMNIYTHVQNFCSAENTGAT